MDDLKITKDENGTLVIDMTDGATPEMLERLFGVVTNRAEENLVNELGSERAKRILNAEKDSRAKIRGEIEYRRYQQMPNVIRHADGVLEIKN